MAYKLHDRKIIPGGLNLAPPEDQTNENDCLVLDGFWPSSVGKLQQTKGYTTRSTAPAADEPHSIAEETGRVYFGAGGELYQIGRAAGAAIESGFDGAPLGLLGFQTRMWIMNRSKQLRDDGANLIPWSTETPPAAPTHTLTTGEHLPDGFYEYFVTWIDQELYESGPSAVLQIDTGTGSDDWKITIHRPNATTPARIYAWNLYRRSPGTFEKWQLNTEPILYATTDYEDTGGPDQTAEDLIGRGVALEEDLDDAPAARVMADKPFNERLVVAGTAEFPNRIYYTKSGQPAFFPRDNFVDCGSDTGDEILRMSVKPGMIIVYRQRSIWRQIGDFDDDTARCEVFVPEIGIVGANAVASTAKGDYFIGGREAVADGVYFLADWPEKVSQYIQPIFQEFVLPYYQLFEQANSHRAALGINGGRLWFSYKQGAYGQTFILDTDTRRWFALKWGWRFSVFYNGSQFFLSAEAEDIVSLEDGLDFAGETMVLEYRTPYIDCGFPDNEKTWADLVLTHHTQGEDFSIVVRTNNNRSGAPVDEFTLTMYNSATLTRQVFPLKYPDDYATAALRGKPIKSLNLSIAIVGPGPAGGFAEFHSPLMLHYYLEARKGVTFDTGITNHGTPDLKRVDQLEIDIDATDGEATLQIWSDIPDNVLVVRLGAGLPVAETDGRQVRVIVLEEPIDGRLFRYQLGTDTALQVYGFRARVLPIGVYLDGANGEYWQCEPISAGAA